MVFKKTPTVKLQPQAASRLGRQDTDRYNRHPWIFTRVNKFQTPTNMSISDSSMSQTLWEQDLQRLRSLSASRPLLVFGVVQRPADDAERLWLLFDAQLLVGCGRAGKRVVCQVLNQVLIAAFFFLVLDSTERQSVTKGSHLTRGSPQNQWMGTSVWSNQTNDTAIAVDEHIMIHCIFILSQINICLTHCLK